MRRETPDPPPSDEAIEIGLRRRAVESAKDAEVLLRWLRLARLDEAELARLLSSG